MPNWKASVRRKAEAQKMLSPRRIPSARRSSQGGSTPARPERGFAPRNPCPGRRSGRPVAFRKPKGQRPASARLESCGRKRKRGKPTRVYTGSRISTPGKTAILGATHAPLTYGCKMCGDRTSRQQEAAQKTPPSAPSKLGRHSPSKMPSFQSSGRFPSTPGSPRSAGCHVSVSRDRLPEAPPTAPARTGLEAERSALHNGKAPAGAGPRGRSRSRCAETGGGAGR